MTTTILSRLEAVETEAKKLRKLLAKKECSIIDRVKTWEDVCDELDIDPVAVLPYVSPKSEDEKAINAFTQINYIRQALNEGWRPNWDDSNEYKYYPYFDMRGTSGGSGFSLSSYTYNFNSSHVGSRLCLKDANRVIYVKNQFKQLYKDYFLI